MCPGRIAVGAIVSGRLGDIPSAPRHPRRLPFVQFASYDRERVPVDLIASHHMYTLVCKYTKKV